jgi:hypothetical protein
MNTNPSPQLPACNLITIELPNITNPIDAIIALLKKIGITIPPAGFPPQVPGFKFPCPTLPEVP